MTEKHMFSVYSRDSESWMVPILLPGLIIHIAMTFLHLLFSRAACDELTYKLLTLNYSQLILVGNHKLWQLLAGWENYSQSSE